MKNSKTMLFLMAVVMTQLLLAANVFATTLMTINVTNNTTSSATPSSVQYTGMLSPTPIPLTAGESKTYYDTGLGNITSFHINYTSGTKKCHFDAALYNQTTSTSPCVYTKAATSTGSTYATCTAAITSSSLDQAACSFTVNFGIRYTKAALVTLMGAVSGG